MFMEPNHSADKRRQTVRGEGEQGFLADQRTARGLIYSPHGRCGLLLESQDCISPLVRGVIGLSTLP